MDPLQNLPAVQPKPEVHADDVISDQKKKLVILKREFMHLKNELEDAKETMDNQEIEIKLLKTKLSERDSMIQKISNEKAYLEDVVVDTKEKLNSAQEQLDMQAMQPSAKLTGNKKTQALEQQNKRLLEDYHRMKEKISAHENIVREKNTEMDELKKQTEELRKQVQEKSQIEVQQFRRMSVNHEDLISKYATIENEYKALIKSNSKLSEEKQRISDDLDRARIRAETISHENRRIQNSNAEQEEMIKTLNSRVLAHGQREADLISKHVALKQQLFDSSNLYYRTSVMRHGAPCFLILKCDYENNYMIVLDPGNRPVSYSIFALQGVSLQDEGSFVIKFKDDSEAMVLEVQDAQIVVDKIQIFVHKGTNV